jgi:uncharacterized OB-fold protein
VKTCVVHIAETGEQKCSRPFIAAAVRIATGGARVPLQYVREPSTLELSGSEVAGASPIAEGMGQSTDTSSAG